MMVMQAPETAGHQELLLMQIRRVWPYN